MTMTFGPNESGRDFVVGDIHGHREMFERLLVSAGFDFERDRVFSVGDLIDRGPDSIGCLRLIREPWFHAVRGNHEDMLIRTCAGNPTSWAQNGGRWWNGVGQEEREEARVLAESLPYAIVVNGASGRFNVLHAEFFGTDADLDEGNLSKVALREILWGRENIGGNGYETPNLSITFVGHTPVDSVRRIGSHLYIDGGACFSGGRLFLIEPATGNGWSVVYESPIDTP